MDRHEQICLSKISYVAITIASLILLHLFLQTPETCAPPHSPNKPHLQFPKSSCDFSSREHIPIDKKNKRIWSTKSWQTKVTSFKQFFKTIQNLGLLKNHTKVLCLSAGAGHEVMALSEMGVSDVTGVELIDSLPLVNRADPHNLPFFDDAFDLAFSGHLVEALFPSQFASEMERTVRPGGVCLIVVEECGDDEVKEIVSLFRNSDLVSSSNFSLSGLRMTSIIMKTSNS